MRPDIFFTLMAPSAVPDFEHYCSAASIANAALAADRA
jgi:hypothetical protein